MAVRINVDRSSPVYRPGEEVRGWVDIDVPHGQLSHSGIELRLDGRVVMQSTLKPSSLLDAFQPAAKPIELISRSFELAPAGHLGPGRVPFSCTLPSGPALYETYHGVLINVIYVLAVEVRRPLLSARLRCEQELLIESSPSPNAPGVADQRANFTIVPEAVENLSSGHVHRVPRFRITGRLDSVVCAIDRPVEGEVCVEESDSGIQSLEVQLVRIETTSSAEGLAREATEIQSIQIANGDVVRGWSIPIHVTLPRLFTCPTVITRQFKVEFEIRLVTYFADGHVLTENFPITVYRPS